MSEIRLFTADAADIGINVREAARYLGAAPRKNREAFLATLAELETLIPEVRAAIVPRACFIRFGVSIVGDILKIGGLEIQSRSLAINLKYCDTVYLFAATAGISADRLINRYARTNPAKSVMCDALFSAAVEGICDRLEREIALHEENVRFRPRFSAGYGDLTFPCKRI